MKFILAGLPFGVLIVLMMHSAIGAEKLPNTMRLSPTAAIDWPQGHAMRATFLQNQSSFLISSKKSSLGMGRLTRLKPTVIATEAAVNRFWRQNLQLANRKNEQSKDQGCRALASGRYRCARTTTRPSGEHGIDIMYWNRGSDLLHIHYSSKSPEFNQRLLTETRVELK